MSSIGSIEVTPVTLSRTLLPTIVTTSVRGTASAIFALALGRTEILYVLLPSCPKCAIIPLKPARIPSFCKAASEVPADVTSSTKYSPRLTSKVRPNLEINERGTNLVLTTGSLPGAV